MANSHSKTSGHTTVTVANPRDHLPDCFGHELWLILVNVVAAVFGDEEAGVRDLRRHVLVRRNGRAWARTASGIGPSVVEIAACRITTLSLPYASISRSP
jgi:hypothetical protein